MKINVLDAVDCEIAEATRDERQWIRKVLSYKAQWYQRKTFGGGEIKHYDKSLIYGGKLFPSGFLRRIHAAAKAGGITILWKGKLEKVKYTAPVSVPGMTLRDDQIKLIDAAMTQQRGVLVSPTGSGKTILLSGLLSAFPERRILVLVHSLDIANQTSQVLAGHGFPITKLGGGSTNLHGRIVVGTKQSMVEKKDGQTVLRAQHREWMTGVDILIVDEVHLWGGESGQYNTVARACLAPMRIGLTGTAPKDPAIAMVLEGAFGPIIGELGYTEAKELNILSEVELELLPVPYNSSLVANLRHYEDILSAALIHSRVRNQMVITKAQQLVSDGMSVLVFVDRVEHGNNLFSVAEVMGLECIFVRGETDEIDRSVAKSLISDSKLRCVIATKVWREGINIPNLGAVILAGGGKAEISVLQSIGRGLRKVEGKAKAVIVDLVDPYRYLAEHSVQRLGVYHKQGWL